MKTNTITEKKKMTSLQQNALAALKQFESQQPEQQNAREARPHQDKAKVLVSARAAESYAAPWMQPLKRAMNHGGTQRANRDRKGGTRKHVQLATVDPATGRPAVRTIVFRGFLSDELSTGNVGEGESCLMTFVTDSRAEKVRHIRETKGPAPVEVCWWLHEAGVQFRISGDAVLACADSAEPHLRHVCQMVWDRLSDSSQNTFSWPHPGAPTTPVSQDDRGGSSGGSDGSFSGVPTLAEANFCVVVVKPSRVDELHLGGKQKRLSYTFLNSLDEGTASGPLDLLALPGGEWRVETVNP